MADDIIHLPDIPEAESAEVDSQSSVLGLVYSGVTANTKRIKTEDIVKGVTDTVETLSDDLDAEEAKTTALNSLYGVVTSLAGNVGLTISSTQDIDNNYITYSLNGNSADAYKPSDLSTWIRRIAQEIEGVTASKDASNVWSLPAYTAQAAMASTYSTDLRNKVDLENKQTNFDHDWTPEREYSQGAVVVYNNQIYQCNTPNSDLAFDNSKWTLITSSGGLSDTDFELWKRLRNLVLEGLARELSPTYMWGNPEDSFIKYSNSSQNIDAEKTYWESNYTNNLGYMTGSNGQDPDNWFNNNYTYYNNSYNKTFYSESVYKSNASKFKTNLLQMLSSMIDAYITFTNDARDNLLSGGSYNHNNYNNLPLGQLPGYGSYYRAGYDSYIVTNTPIYTTDSSTGLPTISSEPTYNAQSDLIKKIVDLCSPKRVTGIFRAANWVTTEQRGRVNWCPLTDIDNPEHAHILHSAYYSTTKPNGAPYDSSSNNGFNYIFYDAIMDVYLPGIENGTSNTDNNLREQILEAFNLIQDTNVSYQITQRTSMEASQQYSSDWNTGAKDMLSEKNNWSIGGDFCGIVAYLDPSATPPSVDIPVQFLVFPKSYDRTDYIQNNS